MVLQHTIRAVVQNGEESGYIAYCAELPVVTQGSTIDETITNLNEAISLHLDGEDLASLGFAKDPVIVLTMELELAHA